MSTKLDRQVNNLRATLILFWVIFLGGCQLMREMPYGNGFIAKNLCSGVFVSDIDPEILKSDYLGPAVKPLNYLWKIDIDEELKIVTVSDWLFPGQHQQKSYYRKGMGCTLLKDVTPEMLDYQSPTLLKTASTHQNSPAQRYGQLQSRHLNVDSNKLTQAIDKAFAEPYEHKRQTAAVVVLYNNQLIAERYSEHIDADTRLMGWSMSKSVIGALIGMLQDRAIINVKQVAPVPEWQNSDKRAITIENLLHMSSGIDYAEKSRGPNADQSRMLYEYQRFSDYLTAQSVIATPGTHFNYSTADTMMLSRILQDSLGGKPADSYRFIHEELFFPLGINDAVLEYDASGQPAGGSYLLMKPRDWAKLGLLHLRDGDWFGEQIISKEWIDYATTPSADKATYGAHLWLNTNQSLWSKIPADAYGFMGYQRQRLVIVPSRQLVVLRMGFSYEKGDDQIDELVSDIMAALPENFVKY